MKKDMINLVEKYRPDILIELGSGYSKDYFPLVNKSAIKNIIQIDKENITDRDRPHYKFVKGDITKYKVWSKIYNIKAKKGLVLTEGLFSYLNDEEFYFVINKLKGLVKKRYSLLTHEPIKPISVSRKIISIFIGKTYRRFMSAKEIKHYYESFGLKTQIIKSNKWQVIYRVYKT
ncbi:MAG: hypothetical protein Q8Q31_02075 [Nanoarchaeota archaeon]|nr:hypothetical protein [Nanoarchaeota archaeon]